MNYGICKKCGRQGLLGGNGICGHCYEMQRLKDENEQLKKEVQHLKDTVCEIIHEEKEVVEPCPICGGRMVVGASRTTCWCSNSDCSMGSGMRPIDLHNALARLIRSVDSLDRDRPWGGDDIVKWNKLFKNRDVFFAECAKVKKEES